ncbi:hypothetical protein QP902_07530 [Corynebacterium marquesiae]|uniref:recombinase RecT n=1 Tax=Corynebacterium marquesiae TaxID=2913503 RepID=UPI0025511C6D|nr:recombinase RecT [Corynebacterium marquesiae]MDK8668527.1 hypothetical protein [Corynebacterium marquesiae]
MNQEIATNSFENTLSVQMKHAEILSQANMIPDKFKGNPANVLVAQELAQSMGESTWVTMSELYFVGNVPTFSAKYMRTRVRAAKHILRESFDPETMTATCTIIRKDDPDFEHTIRWDKAKAEAHGLWGKGHWKKNPELMLKNRAVSECVREACNEVMGGVNYTREEVENGNFNTGPVTATATRQDVAQQALAAPAPKKKQEPEPEQAGEDDDQFVRDVKQALAELTSPEAVTDFMQEIREDAEVPQAILDLGRTRWNELQEQ